MRFLNKYALILGCAILPAFAQPVHSQSATTSDEEPARGWRKVNQANAAIRRIPIGPMPYLMIQGK